MIPSEVENWVQTTSQLITKSSYVVVFTGAGISTPSGIPDFRGEKDGLWLHNDPYEVASNTAFIKNPELFYNWFRPLFLTSWTASPNPAHVGLAKLEKANLIQSIITQNIDGLHQKAGSHKVYELHGSAMLFFCPKCKGEHSAKNVFEQFSSGNLLPLCRRCQTVLKPDIVLFEEPLPQKTWRQAETQIQSADLLLVIGSSLEVYPAATVPETAIRRGCKMIINNLTPTPLDAYADVLIPVDAAIYIPLLVKQLINENSN